MCAQVFAMEGGIYYAESAATEGEVTSGVFIVFGFVLSVFAGILVLLA